MTSNRGRMGFLAKLVLLSESVRSREHGSANSIKLFTENEPMPELSDAGQQLVNKLSQRHGVSPNAITHMLIAVQNGNGSMAQFNHPEFGGCGQWMQGGMTMVSDLFNNNLKNSVNNVCSDIANELSSHQTSPFRGSFQSQSQGGSNSQMQASGSVGGNNSLFVPDPEDNWWPQDLGSPNALGSQNNVKYAYFGNARRLAVKTGGDVWLYDTQDHQIGGFSQQQGTGGSITFTSQFGTVSLSTLPVVTRNGVAPSPPMKAAPPQTQASPPANDITQPQAYGHQSASSGNSDSIFDMLERLGGLRDKSYISEEEFQAKKAELLQRL